MNWATWLNSSQPRGHAEVLPELRPVGRLELRIVEDVLAVIERPDVPVVEEAPRLALVAPERAVQGMQVRESRLRPVLPDEAVDREDHALVREVGEPRGRHLDRVERADLATCSARIFVRIWAKGASVTVILMPVSFSHSGPEKFLSSSAWGPASLMRPIVMPLYCLAAVTAPLAIRSPPTAVDAWSAAAACSVLSHVGAARRRGCQPALDQELAPREAEPGHVLLRHIRIVVHVVTHAFRSFLMACCMTGTPSSACTRRRQVRTPTIGACGRDPLPGRR